MAASHYSIFDPWGPIIALIVDINDSDLALICFSAAGFVLQPVEGYSHRERVRSYTKQATSRYSELSDADKPRAVLNVARFLLNRKPELDEQLDEYLRSIGWQLLDDALVPVGLVEPSDLVRLADPARSELLKAADRILDDPSGAITSACGAIDKHHV